nr:beta-glucuronidase [uncultured Sphaerochaeta sp.]
MYPIKNRHRSIISLSGVWDFRFQDDQNWQSIYVPASFNNQLSDHRARYYSGIVEYRTQCILPDVMESQRKVLRFDAVTHDAEILLDNELICTHTGGFLPFEVDITDIVEWGKEHTLLVRVSNKINHKSFPIGNESGTAFFGSDNPGVPSVERAKKDLYAYNLPNFDFFNYAGITRPVSIYTTPKKYIDDITITTDIDGCDGLVAYTIAGDIADGLQIEILDEHNESVAKGTGLNGVLRVKNAHFWFPKPGTPYLYTAHVTSSDDTYDLPFGIRTIKVDGSRFLINGKPFYFKGAGKHEDSAFRGRGLDECLNVKDVDLLHWLHANSFRTSHYPYAEEMYYLCDREGIVIIDELPVVGLNFNGEINPYTQLETGVYHEQLLKQMIERDKNHPSVVMWSLGNEPDTEHFPEDAYVYWHSLYDAAHCMDSQNRPVTMVCCQNDYSKDITTRSMDVVCINRYYGWYNLSGCLDIAKKAFDEELDFWEKINKPLILSEYGADAIPGFHAVIPEMFSEEFQVSYINAMNECLDKRGFVVGEHVWNFADFDTQQGPMRAGGNHKGLFSRDRSPKMAAHVLRERWGRIENFY